jgi:hypothetical protein
MTYKVINYGTGSVGTHALHGIIGHPELELVGLVDAGPHSAEKAGRDAGDLCGEEPVGVLCSADVDAAIAQSADVVAYFGSFQGRVPELIGEFCRILESGKNIVSTALSPLIHPNSAPPEIRNPIEEACQRGGTSCLCTGIEPGFFSGYLPVVFSGCFQRIDEVRVYEIGMYRSGDQSDEINFDIFGFGGPLDPPPPIMQPEGLLGNWAGVVAQMAEQLGIKLDDIVTDYELLASEESFEYSGRQIEVGTLCGMRFEIVGLVDGKPRVAVEHVTRTRENQAPHWQRPMDHGGYRLIVKGSPQLECDFQWSVEDGNVLSGGFNITAMRAVNAIPAVCEAAPGIVSTFDLPLIKGGRYV